MTTRTTVPHRYFTDPGFEFAALSAVGKAAQGTVDIGVVLTTLDRIDDGDATGWFDAWTATADDLRRRALASSAAGRSATAGHFFLAASDAYSRALAFIDGMPSQDALLPTFRRHRECWEAFVAASGGRHLPVEVPYEGDTLPGYLFRPDASGTPRPTLVITNGSDGSLSGLWAEGIKAALDRGWNAFVFDGPGQQSMLFERGIPFRHDWEAVLTPVVDVLVGRPDVGPLLASGISQGGYWLPRALAFEHRFVAAVVDGGVVDVAETWFSHLPPELLQLLEGGQKETLDHYMAMGPSDPATERELAFRARPYGQFDSAFDLFTAVGRFRLGDGVGPVTTPVLVIDPDDEQFFPGQPQRLFDALPGPKALARFTRDEGANVHCEPLARTLVALRTTDFFDDHLGR
jgi:hypothetical protein